MRSLLITLVAALSTAACAVRSSEPTAELYSIKSRALGMTCDTEFRETARHPTWSVVTTFHGPRACTHIDAEFLELAVFMDLARARGFEYWVDLSGENQPGELASTWIAERRHVVGFLDDPSVDLALAFPNHHHAANTYVVIPADPLNDFDAPANEDDA